jgi:UDP-N-acetylglucosamine:LPS N-acetylglucosamine transferase
MIGRTQYISHGTRSTPWLFLRNLVEAFLILRRERPDVIISTGASPAFPFALWGRLLGVPSIYVECSAQVERPSLSGRLMYPIATRFYYQWEPLGRWFPRGVNVGPLMWSS